MNIDKSIAQIAHNISNAINIIEGLPLYNIILGIETAYQENPELLKFKYKHFSEPSNPLKDIFKATAINDDLSINLNISARDISTIGHYSFFAGYILDNQIQQYQEIPEQTKGILNEFVKIKSREERFDIYEKHASHIIPGLSHFINTWKNDENFIKNHIKDSVQIQEISTLSETMIPCFNYPNSIHSFFTYAQENNNAQLLLEQTFNRPLQTELKNIELLTYLQDIFEQRKQPHIKEIHIDLLHNRVKTLQGNLLLTHKFILNDKLKSNEYSKDLFNNRMFCYNNIHTIFPGNKFRGDDQFFTLNKDSTYEDLRDIVIKTGLEKEAPAYIAILEKQELEKTMNIHKLDITNKKRL